MKRLVTYLLCVVLATLIASCKSKQAVPVAPAVAEVKVPLWVSSRPNNGFKYVGIGVADKQRSSSYQMEAKKNALYDLASEIKVDISTNSVLYTVQNNNQFNENFNSLIKLSNSDNIEGYTLIDSYENDKQYWVYYQLDKEEYARQKAQKKQQIITKAANLIALSFTDERNQDFSASLKKRIQAFGVLTPYLSEEINFDASQTNGIKTVFDLTNLVQQQLQSIQAVASNTMLQLKPYQQTYEPLVYTLQIKNKSTLQSFPFILSSEEEKVKISDKAVTNTIGELQVRTSYVEPINQSVAFSLSPDISTLMGSDSVSRAGIAVLKQFISTPSLKVYANVTPINIFISASELNFGKPTSSNTLETAIQQKFGGQEIKLVGKREEADYIIECTADTQEDVSSDVLGKFYNLKLAALVINLQLKTQKSETPIFKQQISDVFGYANTLDKAGLNAYQNEKLTAKLSEALFFLKRKVLVY
jgi:Asp-tRNA(Asn)/Glu-tRNA(Gln) amidotransferase C subunit